MLYVKCVQAVRRTSPLYRMALGIRHAAPVVGKLGERTKKTKTFMAINVRVTGGLKSLWWTTTAQAKQ